MQQSSATPKNKDVGRGLRKIVACSQLVLSCIYTFWRGVIPTSYFIFTLVSLIFSSHWHGKRHPSLNCMRMRMWYVQRNVHVHTYVRTYTCARQSEVVTTSICILYALLNGNRSGGLGSCFVRYQACTKDHARSKMRPLYVKIMVYRPFSLAVGRF